MGGLKKTLFAILICLCTSIISDCGRKDSREIKIGGIFDITGATREISVAYADGIKCYIEYINKKGGINGRQVKLIDMDYGYLIPRAKTVYENLVRDHKVHAILSWGTGDTEYLRPRIASDRIPLMSASYSTKLTSLSEAPYNFLIGVTYSDQIRILLRYILESWKDNSRKPRVAFMFNETEFGRSPIPDGEAYAAKHGIEVVAKEIVSLAAREAMDQLSRIRDRRADFVIIQETTWAASVILKDARKMGIRATFMGLNWTADEKLIALAGKDSEGFIGTVPFMFTDVTAEGLKDLVECCNLKGMEIKDYMSRYIQGWATAMVMVEGIRLAGDDISGPGILKGLEKIKDFNTGGITAPVTFSESSHAGCRTLKLGRVINGKWRIISGYLSAD
jgi:branched-chain amino acid transport system substrate-binding protein